MNTQVVESIDRVNSISFRRRSMPTASYAIAFGRKVIYKFAYPSQEEIIALAETSNVFDFLHDEPDIYTLEDGEAV